MDTPQGRPKYGMMTNPSRDMVREIQSARRMGFDYVELELEIPEGHPDILRKRRKEITRALELFKHPPLGHTPYWSDLWSDYEEVRQAWIHVMKRSIDACRELGCGKMVIHAAIFNGMYKYSAPNGRHAVMNFIKSLKEIVKYGSGKDVMIVLENMGCFGIPFKTYEYVIENVPGLGVHIDTGHAFLEGGMPMLYRHIRTFRDKLEHFHFSDNLGLEDDHIGIGQGIIDYFRVMKRLKNIGYDKTVSLEVFSGRKELRDSLRIVRAIEGEVWPR